MGALDFAGGTVVHVNAATAALVAALVIGQRKDYARQAILPHNVPFVLLGAGLLWFGWFGFNAGSALAANGLASLAFVNTMLAPAGTLVAWTLVDFARGGKATAVGAATAIVVGLVAITPAAGFVSPMGAVALGAIAALPSYFGLVLRARTGLDDSLDVVAAHGIGGTVGALLTGVLASKTWNGTVDGLIHGNPGQVGIQALAILAAIAYSGVASFLLLKLISLVMPLKVAQKEEGLGLDVSQHGEEAYADDDGAILILQRNDTPQKQGGPALAPAPAGGGRS
jgi:Amt family ammonium transporter